MIKLTIGNVYNGVRIVAIDSVGDRGHEKYVCECCNCGALCIKYGDGVMRRKTKYCKSCENKYDITINGNTAYVYLASDKYLTVDKEDLGIVRATKWVINSKGYVHHRKKGGTVKYLHREILGCKEGFVADHINGDKTDNRKANLRFVNASQNATNRSKSDGTLCKYKGVTWNNRHGKWWARAWKDYKCYHIGYFNDPKDAAIAYDIKVKELHGEYAKTNKQLGLL